MVATCLVGCGAAPPTNWGEPVADDPAAAQPTEAGAAATTTVKLPRIMFWSGKVNQHYDVASGQWQTDPDGRSGADLDPLTYCRKWYPGTVSVRDLAEETISTWREAGNVGRPASATRPSVECVQGAPAKLATARIMYWPGKVNQHFDFPSQSWQTDPDGKSGADIDKVEYCRKWYPATATVRESPPETITTWRGSGNTGSFTSSQPAFECVLITTQIALWSGKVNQHLDASGSWVTDPDGRSGASVDRLAYCRKWYPSTQRVRELGPITLTTWRDAGNRNAFAGAGTAVHCEP